MASEIMQFACIGVEWVLYLLYFYTDVVGISPLLAGWIYALGIAWDAITDPLWAILQKELEAKWAAIDHIFFMAQFH